MVGRKAMVHKFHSYTNIDTAIRALAKLPELDTEYGPGGRFDGIPSFYEDVNPSIAQSHINIWPQPCSSELFIQGRGLSDKILFYDPLGRQLTLPITSADEMLTIDVSNQPNGVLYFYFSGQFFKFLIQK